LSKIPLNKRNISTDISTISKHTMWCGLWHHRRHTAVSSWTWHQYLPLKCWYPLAKQLGVITQKVIILLPWKLQIPTLMPTLENSHFNSWMNSVFVVYMFTALSINISVSAWNTETKKHECCCVPQLHSQFITQNNVPL
jgi:hypothetical protein